MLPVMGIKNVYRPFFGNSRIAYIIGFLRNYQPLPAQSRNHKNTVSKAELPVSDPVRIRIQQNIAARTAAMSVFS